MLLKVLAMLLYTFVLSVLFITILGLGYGIIKESYKSLTVKEVEE
jgi:hypothetical protein